MKTKVLISVGLASLLATGLYAQGGQGGMNKGHHGVHKGKMNKSQMNRGDCKGQDCQQNMNKGDRKGQKQGRQSKSINKFLSMLNLSDAQKVKIFDLQTLLYQNNQGQNTNKADRKAQREARRAKFEQEVLKVLTKEQKEQLETMKKARQENRKARQKG